MQALIDKLGKIPPTMMFNICLLITAILGVVDYLTGDLTLIVFYFIPIACGTWFVGRGAGLVISSICAVELFATDLAFQISGGTFQLLKIWNSSMEALFLLLSAQVLYLFRAELIKSKQRAMELETANCELEAFNYTVAHDLRNPLTWIGGYSNLLLRIYGESLAEQHRDFLVQISAGVVDMHQLIEALLNFARFGRCEISLDPVDLSGMAWEISAELMRVEPARHVDWQIAPGVTVHGDRRLLRVALKNLLENAWKYTGQVEHAVIVFGVATEGEFYVSDNGIGFTEENAALMFKPFQRLTGSEEFRGHGIGLATVQRIIQRHGGMIWAEGIPAVSSSFRFTLPTLESAEIVLRRPQTGFGCLKLGIHSAELKG